MASYDSLQEEKPSRGFLRLILLMVLAFLCGLGLMAWAATRWSAAAPYFSWLSAQGERQKTGDGQPSAQTTGANAQHTVPQTPTQPSPLGAMAMNPAVLDIRVADLEARIGKIAERAAEASSNADRAEAMLVAFATRRSVDRGLPLGYLETLLRERFGGTQAEAVATILTGTRQPVTLDALQAEFETLAPDLIEPERQTNWWASVRREFSNLIVIRKEVERSPRVEERVDNIRHSLRIGRVDSAYAEVNRLLAGKTISSRWMEQARQYLAVHAALDRLETTALLDPRGAALRPAAPSQAPVVEDEVSKATTGKPALNNGAPATKASAGPAGAKTGAVIQGKSAEVAHFVPVSQTPPTAQNAKFAALL